MLLNIIMKNLVLFMKIAVLLLVFGLCIYLLKKTNSEKIKSNEQIYNCRRRNLYLFFVIILIALYVLAIVLRYINRVSVVVEYIDIIIYAVQIAIIYEIIIQIPIAIKTIIDNLNIKELLHICIHDGRLYKVKDRSNRFCVIFGEQDDELIKKIKSSGISWQVPNCSISNNKQKSIYNFRTKKGYTTEGMKNKISYIYIRINPELIENYSNYILEMKV